MARGNKRKTCVSSHDSEEHYSRLQRHIQQNQFLRTYLLQNAAMAGLHSSIIHALQTSPYQPPHITLLHFQAQFQKPNRFPDNIFPQLRSLKRSIRRNKRLLQQEQLRNMDPINWATGTRANRPFATITTCPAYTNTNVHAFVPRRPRLKEQTGPTEYFKEQLYLARDGTGTDPFAHQPPIEIPRGVLKLWVFILVTSIIKPLLDFAGTLITFFLNALFFGVFWVVISPVKLMSRLVAAAEWEMMLMVVLAAQVAKWLPRMDGEVVGEIRGEEPMYTIRIPGGYAIGTGSTFGNSVL
jgi:hypothetical protein